MRTKTTIEIFKYWDQVRGTNAGPLRSEIQPGAIRYVLPDLFILEAAPSGDPVFRLAGTRVCAFFGRELRNAAFSGLWSDDAVGGAATPIAAGVMQHAIPALLNVTGLNRSGRNLRMEMLLLPVRSHGRTYDRILGSLASETPVGWAGAEPLQCLRMERSRLIGAAASGAATGRLPVEIPNPGLDTAAERQVHELIGRLRRIGVRQSDER